LQSIVVAGPFSVLRLNGQSGSVFNVGDNFKVPFFTEAQVSQFLHELQEARGTTIDVGVAEDI
jgi:hypothetical protein